MEVEAPAPPQLQSAVRLPTPDPEDAILSVPQKRKQPSYSRSPSPSRRPVFRNADRNAHVGTERSHVEHHHPRKQAEPSRPLTDAEKQEKAKEEYEKLLNMRSGGTYIPPARLRALQAQVTDKTSKEYQRMAWEALKKSINGLINKVNVSNIKFIVPELFGENLVRGRGLFCRSIMKAQAASLPFTPIYAAMTAIVNTKLPQVGELLMNRLIVQFRKAYRRNDKTVCLSATTFISHLCNQQVIHEILAAQMLQLLLSKPTDDSVEIAVGLTREVGQHLEEMNPQIALLVFDQFRNILHEADIDKRTQYMIEVLFEVRKNKYKDNAAIKEELDLVEEEDQITHQPPGLDATIDVEDGLNIFKFDEEYEEHEEAYKKLKAEILGEASDSGKDDDVEEDESSDDEEAQREKDLEIKDQTNTDLTNLRRTIYLTINSSADFEECCHKLMKINLPAGQEHELPSMIIETCSQRPTYEKFYGLIGERFARLNRLWTDQFEQQFVKYYDTIHRYETNRLRNIANFFAHILSSDAIGWHVFSVVHLNEEETTSSSRIFIKILFQELRAAVGMKKLQERMKDEMLQPSLAGIFPTDHPRNTRFSINYFTSIEMGPLTEGMREFLKNMPRPALPEIPTAPAEDADSDSESRSSYSSRSSYTGSSRSYSRSRSRSRTRSRDDRASGRRYSSSPSRSPRGRRNRARSESLSPSPPRRNDKQRGRARTPSRSPSRSVSVSRSPPRRRNGKQRPEDSVSHSHPPRRQKNRSFSESRSRPPSPATRGRKQSVNLPNRKRNTSSPSSDGKDSSSRSPYRANGPEKGSHKDSKTSAPPARRHQRSSASASPSRSPSPPRRDKRRQEPPQPPRERSLSPFSKRVALTKQMRGQNQGGRGEGPNTSSGVGGGRGGRAKASDFL